MAKKIAVIGTGYVGLVSAVGLADFGNYVTGVDINSSIVDKLNRGEPTIYELGLKDYLERNLESGRLSFTTDTAGTVRNAEIIFLAVGTPPKEDGGADLSQIETAVESIRQNLNGYKVVVTKSTVPVGTNRRIKALLQEKSGNADVSVVSNPEFLREGKAVQDFFHPDRIVIGYEDEKAREYMEDVYRSLYLIQTPFVWCGLETAELIKYASNAFLATKITFINQMARLAEAVGADVHQIAKTMGMDGRISSKFLHPGPGFGGSCFPKDTRAVVSTGDQYKVDMSLIREVVRANELQKEWIAEKVEKLTGPLSEKTVAVLGLAFKAETDDVRESPAIAVVECLLKKGAHIRCHDPEAMDNFKKIFAEKVHYCNDAYEAAAGAHCAVVLTEWNQYRNLDLERMRSGMEERYLFDARNVLDRDRAEQAGFTYAGVGR
jgi:UDPglucose 6-dehydrogenase